MKEETGQKHIKPVCPYCKKEMVVNKFEGYYDTFTYWDCECDDLEKYVENTWSGAYA